MIDHKLEANKGTETLLIFQEEAALQQQIGDVVEVPLLLSNPADAGPRKRAAFHRGMTAGEMVRRLLQEFHRFPHDNHEPNLHGGLINLEGFFSHARRATPLAERTITPYSLEPAMRPFRCRHHPKS